MKIPDLKIGMLVSPVSDSRQFDYKSGLRVEATGYDWAILRAKDNRVYLADIDNNFELYKDED